MTDFERALYITLQAEGGYVNDPDDRGGATNMGITQRTYDKWRKQQHLAFQDVRWITYPEVEAIYRTYWEAAEADQYEWPLNVIMFDMAVNHGPRTARKLLQQTVGVTPDGIVGPLTRAALHPLDTDSLSNEVLWVRVDRYRRLSRTPGQIKFLPGWLNRVKHLRAEVGLDQIRLAEED